MRKFMMAAMLAMAVVGCKTDGPVAPDAVSIVDEPDAPICGTHDEIAMMAEGRLGMSLSSVKEPGMDVYISGYPDGGVRHVIHGETRDCFVDEEPTGHTHDSETGAIK